MTDAEWEIRSPEVCTKCLFNVRAEVIKSRRSRQGVCLVAWEDWPLYVGACKKYWEPLDLLSETKEDIGQRGTLKFLCLKAVCDISIEHELPEKLEECVLLGFPKDKEISPGKTLLTMCIDRDSELLIRKLIELGCDLNQDLTNYESPLHYCVEKNKLTAARTLLTAGAETIDVNKKGSDGNTALHLAVKQSQMEMIRLLVSCGADVNAKGRKGYTPLHIASMIRSGPEQQPASPQKRPSQPLASPQAAAHS